MTAFVSGILAAFTGLLLVFVATTNAQGWNDRNTCKKGLCPYVRKLVPDLTTHPALSHYSPLIHGSEPPSLCGNLCTNDYQCPHQQKCCATNCGYACFEAVFVSDNDFHLIHGHHHESHHSIHHGSAHHHDSHHNVHHGSSHHDIHLHSSHHHSTPHHDTHHNTHHHDSHETHHS